MTDAGPPMEVILRISPVVSTRPNLPRSPIMRLPNQAGRRLTASSGSVMRVHVKVPPSATPRLASRRC